MQCFCFGFFFKCIMSIHLIKIRHKCYNYFSFCLDNMKIKLDTKDKVTLSLNSKFTFPLYNIDTLTNTF